MGQLQHSPLLLPLRPGVSPSEPSCHHTFSGRLDLSGTKAIQPKVINVHDRDMMQS